MISVNNSVKIAIAWCLAWGNERKPQFDIAILKSMCDALRNGQEVPKEVKEIVDQAKKLQEIDENYFPKTLEELKTKYSDLWNQNTRIGLVYGGVTKVKQYVFESAKLPDIRGASGLLDRINLIDLPAFFSCEQSSKYEQCERAKDDCQDIRENWLDQQENFPELSQALIPELIIYSTGGNLLAFCPAGFIDDLANAIEKRYTHETLTANSCAVGAKFKLLEIRFGLLPDQITNDTFWLEQYQKNKNHPLISAYFQQEKGYSQTYFQDRKTFNELAGKLASLFNQRRNGNQLPGSNRPLRCYPPIFETHPYLKRDEGDRRSAIIQVKTDPEDSTKGLPGDPWFSEASARKRLVGQITKRDNSNQQWYEETGLTWQPGSKEAVESWVNKFEQFLYETPHKYYGKIRSENLHPSQVKEALSVREIGDASISKGFVAYIYADGNNMGRYIQKEIKTPESYQNFSRDIFYATEKSVYAALTKHLAPHKLSETLQAERKSKKEIWIHPFEILTIGGDDVMLIVPADKALAIAKSIGEEFERILLSKEGNYKTDETYISDIVHRYHSQEQITTNQQCKLSMSTGVLITAEDTPIYYAQKLTNQLLKSAKKLAKDLKECHYYGGTVDFLVMKSVTMISSNISEFRTNGLTKLTQGKQKLKLYAAPYTLHELGGLLKTAQTLIDAEFPKSQLYQIRSLLERGKQTAILNYRYFRVRLNNKEAQKSLEDEFEKKWCLPKDKDNSGNLAPWMSLKDKEECEEKNKKSKDKKPQIEDKVTYETIWRELVDLYPFFQKPQKKSDTKKSKQEVS
ncbi:type III-B CRISPR-associated protein Cas10/Cmr2 [Anabaena sp. FACHB-1237]|uniref:type III-B CRISPR-associated protein Cas10/Cmr2 n=1 Tax=Anabaena sp. FACHB-1237 TaxID=2692769 RepID=UPI001680D8FD|nr:type III-B CRISPR-associated protein Cas10/Cmr2 [Anabaena sp. FACHB-1237]